MSLAEFRDAHGIEPVVDEPPALYCLACASAKKGERRRVEQLEEAIRQAVTDLRCGVPREVVAVNLDAAEGPF